MIYRLKQSGFSLIELLVAISFISAMIVLILTVSYSNNKLRVLNEERTQALFYASEGMEAVKLLDWDDLVAGNYAVDVSVNQWQLTPGNQILGIYTREVTIEDVYRENISNGHTYGDISVSGNLDSNTKKIISTVTWTSSTGNIATETLESYIHRWGASRLGQTDWAGGSGQNLWSDETMFYSNDSGMDLSIPGIATLKSGFIDWSDATTTATFNTSGNFDDNDVYEADGVAYLITENNPYGPELYILDVSDSENPTQLSSLNIGDGVTAVVAQGDYVYLSTEDNSGEVKIVDASNLYSPFVTDSYDLPSNDNASDVVVGSTELYVAQGSNLYSFSILSPDNLQYLDQIGVGDIAQEIYLSEDYVYMATNADSRELQIIEVTNPANLNPAGEYDLPGSLKSTDVFVRGSRAYISTQNNGSGAEFFIFDITDPTTPIYVGDYEVNETIHSFAIVGPYALMGTNFLNEELVVVDVSVPASISFVAGFDLDGYVLGMSANCSLIYAATSGDQGEFFIISTEVTDCDYANSGVLESSTFDSGSTEVVYNWIAWNGSEPSNTDIRFQFATSNDVGGPWSFVGPDGTSSTYYSVGAQEFINYDYHLNQRYFRYKLFLTSQADLQVPILEDVIISYSIY